MRRIHVDTGTTIAMCVLATCLMAPIIIDSLGDAGAFQIDRKKKRREEKKINKQEKEK